MESTRRFTDGHGWEACFCPHVVDAKHQPGLCMRHLPPALVLSAGIQVLTDATVFKHAWQWRCASFARLN